jgi:hypothetical protein
MVHKRIGYFLKETNSSGAWNNTPKFAIRYFLISNNCQIYYTENYAQLVQIIKEGGDLKNIFERAEKDLKKIKISDLKPSEIKKYDQPELLPFLNQFYFEIFLSLVSGNNMDNSTVQTTKNEDVMKLMFFSFKDYHLENLRKFTASYTKFIKSDTMDEQEDISHIQPQNKDFGVLGRYINKQITEKNEKVGEKLSSINEQGQKIIKIMDMIKNPRNNSNNNETLSIEVNSQKHRNGDITKGEDLKNGQEEPLGQVEGKNSTEDSKSIEGKKGEEKFNMEEGKETNGNDSSISDGKGKEYFANDLTYVGEFRGGKKHGVGYFVTPSIGMCYVECINGEISGI